MTIPRSIKIISLISLLAAALAISVFAQKPGSTTPRQEKLLNGLKVLVWNEPAAEKVTVKLRIHSGAAFDPQDREGVMNLLSRSFFPNKESREFFRDELGGELEVTCNYDYIQIEAEARSSEFLRLMQSIAAAISNPALDKEATAELKTELLAEFKQLETNPEYVADRAVAKRLFGAFPYGRPEMGTAVSIQKIDFADLRFAKDRLLTADNATLAVSGNVNADLAVRAVRRYFGSWLKSDKKSPYTFRQPDAPAAGQLDLTMAGLANSEVRYAIRGVARSSSDFAAAETFSRILAVRFRELSVKSGGLDSTVLHEGHILPGAFVFRYKSQPTPAQLLPVTSQSVPGIPDSPIFFIFNQQSTDAEFAKAKSEALGLYDRRKLEDRWLDVDTFKITSVADELKAFQNVTIADVNALSQKLARQPVAIVALARETATAKTND